MAVAASVAASLLVGLINNKAGSRRVPSSMGMAPPAPHIIKWEAGNMLATVLEQNVSSGIKWEYSTTGSGVGY